jgi:hypothetical protein
MNHYYWTLLRLIFHDILAGYGGHVKSCRGPQRAAVAQRKPSLLSCARCSLVNAIENKFCSKCSCPLTLQAYEEIKAQEDAKLKVMEERHKQDMDAMREEMNKQFTQIMSMIQQNPILAQVKPEALTKKRKCNKIPICYCILWSKITDCLRFPD